MAEYLKIDICKDCPAQPFIDDAEEAYIDMPHSRFAYELLTPSGQIVRILETIDTPRDTPRTIRLQRVAEALNGSNERNCVSRCSLLQTLVRTTVRDLANAHITS